MSPDEDWQRLIDGLRAGDSRIEHEFWGCYGAALQRLAEQRLSPKLQARVGPEDVAQSACRTFLRRARGGEFQLPDSNALWQILCVITLTKVREQARFHRRHKRSIDREVPLDPAGRDSRAAGFEPADPRAESEEAMAIAEEMEHVLSSLDDEDRQVVSLKLQDLTNDEVAQRLNLSERTVRRMLKAVQARLTRALDGGEA
jgi:RNA polymerase sigma factor (sigma-70 family)